MKNNVSLMRKRLVAAFFRRKNASDSVGNHMPAKEIQQFRDKPKEPPRNNHLRDLPPAGEYSPISMPRFLHRFPMNLQFLNGYPRPRNWL